MAEITSLDEGDREPALRGVIGDRQPVDAAADNEHVDVAVGQARKISNQTGTIL